MINKYKIFSDFVKHFHCVRCYIGIKGNRFLKQRRTQKDEEEDFGNDHNRNHGGV